MATGFHQRLSDRDREDPVVNFVQLQEEKGENGKKDLCDTKQGNDAEIEREKRH